MIRMALALLLVSFAFALPAVSQATLFGAAVAAADVNGDGFSDVIVGEPHFDRFLTDEGRVLVYLGSAAGPASSPSWSRRGLQAGAHFGATVAGLGDVNGDGFEDVAIGAPDYDAPRPSQLVGPGAAQATSPFRNSGAFVVFLGSASGLGGSPALVRPGIQHEEHVGAALARAGDVNGDGFDDVLVGATGTDGDVGAAFVFHGSASGPDALPEWIAAMPLGQPHTGFARALAGGGDVNGDGYDDVVVGAPDAGDGRGTAYAYYGSAAGLSSTFDWTLGSQPTGEGPLNNGNNDWGMAVGIVGDANGDGFDDLCVGDPNFDGDLSHGSGQYLDTGVAHLYAGSSTGLGPTRMAQHTGTVRALSVAGAVDVNGNGRSDVCYGGSEGGICFSVSVTGSLQSLVGLTLGSGMSSGGDLNGDGFGDLLDADPFFDFAGTDRGVVYYYLGAAGGLDTYGQLFAP